MKSKIRFAVLTFGLITGVLIRSPQGQIKALAADGPAREYADKMMLFGQFVGDWEFDLVSIRPDGTRVKGIGKWHFGWTLDGRAVQDVWIARNDISQPSAPVTEWGTTVRFYDPKTDEWRVVWAGPMGRSVMAFTAKKVADEIVMEVDYVQGLPRMNPPDSPSPPVHRGRWIFDQITAKSFHWSEAISHDRGKTWQVESEMFVRRIKN